MNFHYFSLIVKIQKGYMWEVCYFPTCLLWILNIQILTWRDTVLIIIMLLLSDWHNLLTPATLFALSHCLWLLSLWLRDMLCLLVKNSLLCLIGTMHHFTTEDRTEKCINIKSLYLSWPWRIEECLQNKKMDLCWFSQ